MNTPNRKEKAEKTARKIQKELGQVYKEIKDLGWKKLDKPIRHGYDKSWVVRKDILKSKKGKLIDQVLDIINVSIWWNDKSFLAPYKDKYIYDYNSYATVVSGKKGSKILLNPGKRKLSQKKYDLLEPKLRPFFRAQEIIPKWGSPYNVYITILTYELDIKITKSYITHRKIMDPSLEKRRDELDKEYRYLINTGVLGCTWKDWHVRSKYKSSRMLWRNEKSKITKGDDNYDEYIDSSYN